MLVTILSLVISGCSASPTPSPQEKITPGVWRVHGIPGLFQMVGFYDFDIFLTIDVDPGIQIYYYWAHQFSLGNGDIGYMGLQTNGITL